MTASAPLTLLGGAVAGLGIAILSAGIVTTVRTRMGQAGAAAGRRWWRRRIGMRALISAICGLAAGAVTRWPAAVVLAAVAAWWLPRLVGGDRHAGAGIERIEAIASWTESLRDTLSAAAGLEQAILATAPLAPAPINEPLSALTARLRTGDRLTAALRAFGDELADPTADLVVAALTSAAEHQGGDLAALLGELASAARDHATMRLRLRADRARIRTSSRIITGATIAMAAGLVLWSRDFLAPYDTATGQLVLLGIGTVFAAGFSWLDRLARIEEPGRILLPAVPEAPAAAHMGGAEIGPGGAT